MSEELIVRHCSPTLAGIKTGSLFNCSYSTKEQLRKDIRGLNRRLAAKGVRIVPLKITDRTALIYVYRPKKLGCDLSGAAAAEMLSERGYLCEMPGRCVVRLAVRLREREEFPHEIGLFLGYPPEDVRGFIDNRAGSPKLTGYWKVYGDKETAVRLFNQYRKCTEAYVHQLKKGSSLEKLTITV